MLKSDLIQTDNHSIKNLLEPKNCVFKHTTFQAIYHCGNSPNSKSIN